MMDIISKDFPVSAGEPTDEYPNGTFEVVLSAPTLDRDGEVVDAKAFEPLPDHITFDTDHSMTCDSVVGSGTPSYSSDGRLIVKGGYADDERSQSIRRKVAQGHIRTTSVTFMAAEREKDSKGVPHVVKAELLNGTFTPVPSNRESVVLTAKSIMAHDLAEKVGARNNKDDAAAVQFIHDTALSLGAMCAVGAGKSAPAPVENGTEADEKSAPKNADTEHSADSAAAPAAEAAEATAKSTDEGSEMKARMTEMDTAITFALGD